MGRDLIELNSPAVILCFLLNIKSQVELEYYSLGFNLSVQRIPRYSGENNIDGRAQNADEDRLEPPVSPYDNCEQVRTT